jgi:alkylation response protein AidB-like acyl-CoA dehydrogenase
VFDFGLTEELALLQGTARSFAEKELWPRLRSAEAARAVEPSVYAAYARTGLRGLELPPALGGAGMSLLARVLVNEELGAADPGAALALDGFGPAASALVALGEGAELAELIAPLAADPEARAWVVSAHDARFAAAHGKLSGEVAWLPAGRVDLLIVLQERAALLVPRPGPLEPLPGSGLRAAGASALRVQDAPIAMQVANPARVAAALAGARLYTASLLLGVLRRACEYARAYALERVAFGKPIAHHQALAFMLTDMHSAVAGARLLVHEAACRAERGLPFEAAAASAFVEVVEASRAIGPGAVQVLGGHGFMQDHPVEKAMREARALGLLLGGVDAAREDAGRALCESALPLELSAWEAS